MRFNNKGANWSLVLSGFVGFVIVMFAGAGAIGDMGTNYGVDNNGQFDNTFNKFTEISNLTGSMSQTLQTGTVESTDFFTTLSRNALASLKILFGMPALLMGIVGDISIAFGFPYWVLPTVVLLIIMSFGIMVLIAFLKSKLEDN